MTAAQDSRAQFEAWRISEIRKVIPGIESDKDQRIKDVLLRWDELTERYLTKGEQRAWETWQASRAALSAEPVASVYTMEALVPGGREVSHVRLHKPLPAGTTLYAAPQPAAQERKPLTDAQIDDLHGEANRGFDIERDAYFKAVRDAERAHGVTGDAST